jgi:2-polyprenyl-3-methyl-5-hydroxy-6-metoxy-1,4-benzoquinol methylase
LTWQIADPILGPEFCYNTVCESADANGGRGLIIVDRGNATVPLLAKRRREPEVMDDPGLAAEQHSTALRGLARLNLFGSARVLWPALAARARRRHGRTFRVLDIACGGGDVPLRLWRRSRRAGLSFQIEGCDCNPFAVSFASAAAARAGADLRFFVHDVLNDAPLDRYDAVMTSLFLHHLEVNDAIRLLRFMTRCGQLVLVNDLERSALNYAMVFAASRLLTMSPVVHVDALRSVRAAFTLGELCELASAAGLTGATVVRRPPCRLLLTAERP